MCGVTLAIAAQESITDPDKDQNEKVRDALYISCGCIGGANFILHQQSIRFVCEQGSQQNPFHAQNRQCH